MAKFYGKVGFGTTVETKPGVWTEEITEVLYSGDVTQNARRWQTGLSLNEDLALNMTISIIANEYAMANMGAVKYVIFKGVKWKVAAVDIKHPRLILTIGGVYNGI